VIVGTGAWSGQRVSHQAPARTRKTVKVGRPSLAVRMDSRISAVNPSPTAVTSFGKCPCRALRRIAIFGRVDSDVITDAMRDAVDALTRANVVLRDSADPLAAAADSALSCAATLMALHQRRAKGEDVDVVVLRDALGAARALVSEISFAVREKC
jgi:hypothetical protein